jgi:hypothetical protein
MQEMDLSAIAIQGLSQADTQLEQAATAIASEGALAPDGSNVDIVDLSAEIVALSSTKIQFSANLATLKVANEIQKETVDLVV